MKTNPSNEAQVYHLCPGVHSECLSPLSGVGPEGFDDDLCLECEGDQRDLFEGWDQESADLKRADEIAMQHAYGFRPTFVI